MNPRAALKEFERYLSELDLQRASLSPEHGLAAMLSFYRDVRADRCPLDEDADMLLYQWGTYDWGQGRFFELNITRQLIFDASGEDDDIWQLSLTFKYRPSSEFAAIEAGNKWCENVAALQEFQHCILSSQAFEVAQSTEPANIELRYECAG